MNIVIVGLGVVGGSFAMALKDIIKILPQDIDFVFGHPMEGREKLD